MIYVCVPARDEARTLGPLLWKVRKVLGEFGREFRLVVFDDGSSDDTAEVLERYTSVLPLTVLRDEKGVGYGVAVDRMLRHVVKVAPYPKRDSAIVLQGDFSENPDFLVDLVKTLEGGVDVVASSVSPPTADEAPKPRVWGRRLAPWVLGGTWRKAPVEDPVSGLRAYRVIVLKKALREGDAPLSDATEPWVASLELLRRVVPYARRVEDTPTRLRYPLPARDSRFRTVRALRSLFGVRGVRWPEMESGAKKTKKNGGGASNSKSGSKSGSKGGGETGTKGERPSRQSSKQGSAPQSNSMSGPESDSKQGDSKPGTEQGSGPRSGDAPANGSGGERSRRRRRGSRGRRGGRGRGRGNENRGDSSGEASGGGSSGSDSGGPARESNE